LNGPRNGRSTLRSVSRKFPIYRSALVLLPRHAIIVRRPNPEIAAAGSGP